MAPEASNNFLFKYIDGDPQIYLKSVCTKLEGNIYLLSYKTVSSNCKMHWIQQDIENNFFLDAFFNIDAYGDEK